MLLTPVHSQRLAVALLLLGLFASHAASQPPPFSLRNILNALEALSQASGERKTAILAKLINDIKTRRVNFPLTDEKEADLRKEGAPNELIAVIQAHSPTVPKAAPTATPAATPAPTPIPPDFAFFLARADTSFGKGMFGEALVDYDKAIELKGDNATAFLRRGITNYNLESVDKAVADFDRAIQIDPKNSLVYYHRGAAHEKKGRRDAALADYQKAVELDPANELAKANLKKVQDELARATAPPESIALGAALHSYAVHLQNPTYPEFARRANIRGRVVVEVMLDETGAVVSAKAVTGHQSLRGPAEDAVRRSTFRPGKYKDQAIKATGTIVYVF